LYVTGLILLDARPTQTGVTRVLPGRCHDARNRLLRTTPWSTRKLLAPLVAWIRHASLPGSLCLDDVVVEQAFAKRLRRAGWTYSFAKKGKVYGMHIVVLWWCSTDRRFRIPVAFGLWRPKWSCAPAAYQTKLQLAAGMLTELVAARLPFSDLVMEPTTPPAGSLAWPAGWGSAGWGRCRHPPRSSGAVGGSRSPSWPAGCAGRGGRRLACARPRSPSMRPATARSGWS
jgi:hypothetical protein